jgi:2-hydroxychromene-2-carboxylate isomerase
MPPRLEFWFDFASTYSYPAAMRIAGLCEAADVELAWRPFTLGPIFAAQGWNDSHFNLNPLRGNYMLRDLERICAKFDFPWRRPQIFPQNSVAAGRVAAAHENAPWIGDFVRAIYVANFGEGRDISDRAVIADLLGALGLDPGAIFAHADSSDAKPLFRANTERAIALGIFGAPNCVTPDGELFWGEEALEDAIAWSLNQAAR